MKTTKIALLTVLATLSLFAKNENVGEVNMPLYKKECGSCHMAYQPKLLNQPSWGKMMDNLKNHFGTDASLEPDETAKIRDYLTKESSYGEGGIHDKISSQRWFVKEHRKISPSLVSQPAVKSWANCAACHKTAEKGQYGDRYINIPGYGAYRD